MADLIISPTASAVASGLASGTAGAILLSAASLTWPLVLWGTLGCVVGLSAAPATSRWRAVLLFVAASLISALAGSVVSVHWFAGSEPAAQGLAALAGIVFHPTASVLMRLVPAAIERKVAQ